MTTTQRRLRLIHRIHAALTAVILVVLLVLRLTGAMTTATAATLFLAIELPLMIVFLLVTIARFSRSSAREACGSPHTLLERIGREEPLLRPAITELRMFGSLVRLITRRRRVPAGATPFGYTRQTMAIPLVFIGLSLVELVVVHLMVPWVWMRVVLLVLTVWGVVFLLGYLASRIVHPHAVTPDELQLRWGLTRVLTVARADIVDVAVHLDHSRTQPELDGELLVLTAFQSANVRVRFAAPIPADPPVARKQRTANVRVREVRLYVDEPEAFVVALATNTLTGAQTEGAADAR